jgi:hypothetical protein
MSTSFTALVNNIVVLFAGPTAREVAPKWWPTRSFRLASAAESNATSAKYVGFSERSWCENYARPVSIER